MKNNRLKYALILGTLTALGPLCTDFYLSALPTLTEDLKTSTSTAQLTLTATLIGLGIGQFAFGPLSDRIGRMKPLLFSLVLFILTSLWCALTQDVNQLIVARFLQGVAGAGGAVLSRAIARDLYSGKSLTSFFSLLMTINGIAPVAAPVLGSLQLSLTGWRGLFITLSITGVLILIACITGLKESLHKNTLSDGKEKSPGVFSDPNFISFSLVKGFMMAGLFAYIGASTYVLQDIYKMSPQAFSLTFAINGIGLVISALLVAKLSSRFKESSVLKYSLIMALIFSLCLVVVFQLTTTLFIALVILFLTVSMCSGICTLASSLAMQNQGGNAGTASAWMGMLMFAMGGISAPLTGFGGTSATSMSVVIAGSYLLAFIAFLFSQTGHTSSNKAT